MELDAPASRDIGAEPRLAVAGTDSHPPMEFELEALRDEVLQLREQRRGMEASLAQRTVELLRTAEALQDEIARRRWAEKNLGQSEARYQSIFEHAVEGIYQSTPEGKFMNLNPALARMYGYDDPEEALADISDISKSVYVSLDDLAEFREEIERRGLVRNMEYRVHRRDGEIIWIRENARGVFDPKGKLLYYEGMIQDVTTERRSREEKEQLEGQLLQAQKMEAVGSAGWRIAHDFNNILGVIIGYAELVLQDLPHDSRNRSDAQEILSSANRAKNLVQQILTFSRQQKVEPKPLQLGPVIEEGVSMLRATLPSTIEIRFEAAVENDWVVGDPVQFQQVLLNLGVNAAHAMRDHGGVLSIRLDPAGLPPVDWLATARLSTLGWVRILVTDTGCGMSPNVLEHLFEPYFTTKPVGEGTGLGLSVVHGIVKGFGGEIQVRSDFGKGTEFEIFLPVCTPGDADPVPQKAVFVPQAGRLLLVDDEPALLRVMSLRLERMGFTVDAFSDVAEALEHFSQAAGDFDVVITDQTMPGMTGLDFARKLRGIRAGIPVILCTGYQGIADDPRWKEVANFILTKPVDENELSDQLQQCTRPATP